MPGVRNHEDLVAWKLCCELKTEVFAFTARHPANRDFKFCDQIRSASCSASDLLAEGFYRYQPRDFARFCAMCRGSLGELKSQLRHAQEMSYVSAVEFDRLWQLACRAMAATTNLQKYLNGCIKQG